MSDTYAENEDAKTYSFLIGEAVIIYTGYL